MKSTNLAFGIAAVVILFDFGGMHLTPNRTSDRCFCAPSAFAHKLIWVTGFTTFESFAFYAA